MMMELFVEEGERGGGGRGEYALLIVSSFQVWRNPPVYTTKRDGGRGDGGREEQEGEKKPVDVACVCVCV